LQDIWLGLLFCCIAWHFIYQRKLAEAARHFVEKYCKDQDIQFMSIAKIKTRLVLDKSKGLMWRNHYCFEFSGDGERSNEGTLILRGDQVELIDLPPYPINASLDNH
jgi:hypothetical protein